MGCVIFSNFGIWNFDNLIFLDIENINFWIYMYVILVGQAFVFEPPHDKTNKITVRPAKTQIRLGIRPVWSESSLRAQWVAKDLSFLHADSEDWSDWANAQADLSLRWTHSHFAGFVMRRLISFGGWGLNLFCQKRRMSRTGELNRLLLLRFKTCGEEEQHVFIFFTFNRIKSIKHIKMKVSELKVYTQLEDKCTINLKHT